MNTRIRAANRLAKQAPGNAKAIAALSHLMGPNHRDFYEVKEAAAKALGDMGVKAKSALPALLTMFEKADALPILRKACLKAINKIAPQDKRLIPVLAHTLTQPHEATFFELGRRILQRIHPHASANNKQTIKAALEANRQLKQPITSESTLEACANNRLGFSRTLRSGKYPQAFINFQNALAYIGQNATLRPKPTKADYIALNGLLIKDMDPVQVLHPLGPKREWGGFLRGSDPAVSLELPHRFPKEGDVPRLIDEFFAWFDQNFDTMDPFRLAAATYQKLIKIHPFYDGAGRTTRLLTDWALFGRGYYMPAHPDDYIRGMTMTEKAFANLLKKSSVKISEADPMDPVLRTFQGWF